jgi:hypothetical protein
MTPVSKPQPSDQEGNTPTKVGGILQFSHNALRRWEKPVSYLAGQNGLQYTLDRPMFEW